MPMMPFMGVRISWLMLARNLLFARVAVSAASRAAARATSALLRSVMSWKTTTPPRSFPDWSRSGRPLTLIQTPFPVWNGRMKISALSTSSPRMARAEGRSWTSRGVTMSGR